MKGTSEQNCAFRTSLWNQFYSFLLDIRPQASYATSLYPLAITVKQATSKLNDLKQQSVIRSHEAMSSLGSSAAAVSQTWLLLADVTHAPAGSWQVVGGWLV